MVTSVNIATQEHRLDTLKLTVESLYNQVDIIRIYLNDFKEIPKLPNPDNKITYTQGKDLTDNAKFYFLNYQAQNEYYFTVDDDLIFSEDYIKHTIDKIDRYNCIVTYHGRILQGLKKEYYRDHIAFLCLDTVEIEGSEAIKVDVCGTGVTAFNTNYFHPKDLHLSEVKKMSDLVFSLEAASQGKTIGLFEHGKGWIKEAGAKDGGVFRYWQGKPHADQNRLADEIYKLNHKNLLE
jgi:hypothetical protein